MPPLARALVPLLVVASLLAAAPAAHGASRMERQLLTALNEARAAHGRERVGLAPRLDAAADAYARKLMRTDVFAHPASLPLGVGETLAWGTGGVSARAVVRLWLASPPHRRIVLWRGARKVGVGVESGTFQGHAGARVVVARFAR